MSVHELPRRGLTPSAARQLTDSIKRDAESLFTRLLNAYEQGVHTALGYSSWAAYCKTEFGRSETWGHQMLDAGKVVKAIETHSANAESRPNEWTARRLKPILKEKGEKAVAEVWDKAVEEHGPNPTGEQVEEVMRAMAEPEDEPEPEDEDGPELLLDPPALTKEQERFARALRSMALDAEYISLALAARRAEEKEATRRLLTLPEEVRADWDTHIKVIDNAARQLRRYVTGRKNP